MYRDALLLPGHGQERFRVRGTPFGRYRLIQLVGRGGMGEVWRAFDTETERLVAVKLLPAALADDRVFAERFRREAKATAALNEPHVIPIHHFGEIDGRLYLDMRLIEGRDLSAIIAGRPLDPVRAVLIVEQIAAALYAAHRIGLVHRDVKPSNVLVAARDFAYLIDFGIARAAGDSVLTSADSMLGTWAYMPPERFDTGAAAPSGDVYSLTCVLFEALTGRRPFPGGTPQQQFSGHISKPPPRPTDFVPALPAAFNEVIAKGMAKNPDHRYTTAVALAEAARIALDGTVRRVHSPAPGPLIPVQSPFGHVAPAGIPVRERGRRGPWIVGVCSLAVVALVAALGLALVPSEDDPAAATPTTTRTPPTTAARETFTPTTTWTMPDYGPYVEPAWKYAVTGVETAETIPWKLAPESVKEVAEGVFVIVVLEVTNGTDVAQGWTSIDETLLNGTFPADREASRLRNDGYAFEVQPGQTRTVGVVFDVPVGTQAVAIRVVYRYGDQPPVDLPVP